MKIQVFIELLDQTSEEQMAAEGTTPEELHDLYTMAFGQILQNAVHPALSVDLRVVVTDNTKEAADESHA